MTILNFQGKNYSINNIHNNLTYCNDKSTK